MKRIGLLGGMSWESTAEYYRLMNQEVARRLGGLHSAQLVLASVDFAEIEHLQTTGQWDAAGRALATEAKSLHSAGADFLVLCTNTMHKVADQIQTKAGIPLLHIADATAAAVVQAQVQRVGLLGTAFTMEQDFYRGRLHHHGLEVLVPDAAARREVHRIIFEELCHGVIREESRSRYHGIIDDLRQQGADGVILGCTEIELLVNPEASSSIPLFPTTRIHAAAAVDEALGSGRFVK